MIINLKSLNSYLVVSHFKMENIGSLKHVLQEGNFMGKIDLEDAYFFSASSTGTSRFPEVLLETKDILVQIPTIRPGYSTKSLHKNSAASRSKNENDRVAYLCLSGRYFGHGTVSRDVEVAYADSCQRAAGTGFQAESQEMCLGTSASNRVSEFPGELQNNEDLSAGGEDSESDERVQTHNQQEISDSSTPGPFDRATVIYSTSSQCGTPPLSRSSEVASKSSADFPRNYDYEILVDQEAEADLQWWVDHVGGSNGHPVVHPSADMVLTTDASKSG